MIIAPKKATRKGLKNFLFSCLLKGRWVVLVDSHGAHSDISSVLLGMRTCPASERGEVREGRIIIIMCIPERELTSVAVRGRSEDGRPLGSTRIDAASDTVSAARIFELLVPVLVCCVVALPVLRAFDIQPDAAAPLWGTVRLEVVYELAHLRRSRFGASRARKQVHWMWMNNIDDLWLLWWLVMIKSGHNRRRCWGVGV